VYGIAVLDELLYSSGSLIMRRAYQAVRDRGGLASPKLVAKRALRLSGKAPDFSPAICEAILGRDPAFHRLNGHWYIKPLIECKKPISECEFTVLDFEATGGKPPDDKITEVAMVRFKSGKVVDEFSTLVNPGRQIPHYVVKLIGITDRMVGGCPSIEDIIGGMLEFMRGSLLVVHNASGDLPFLDYECIRLFGGIVGLPVFDTQHMARKFIPDIGGLGLERIATHFGVELTDRHRAMGDVRTTCRILECFLDAVGTRLPHEVFL
jgi:DNA polymerase III epsilon subunit family exonuclease